MTQSKPIDLQEFCDKSVLRHYLRTPFNDQQHSYATNYHVMVSTPLNKQYDSADKADAAIASKLAQQFNSWLSEDTTFASIPEYELPESVECLICKGTGHAVACEQCNGSGYTDCHCCGREIDCEFCDGTGHQVDDTQICTTCAGEGVEYKMGITFKDLPPGTALAVRYIKQIEQLPDIQIDLANTIDNRCRFKFTGGEGVVMLMRQ